MMKKLTLIFLLLPLFGLAQKSRWKIDKVGINAGYMHSFQFWKVTAPFDMGNAPGFSTSLYAEHYIGPNLSVKLGLGYQTIGMKYTNGQSSDAPDHISENLRTRQLTGDLILKGYFTDRRHRPYVLAGTRAMHTLGEKYTGSFGGLIDPAYTMEMNQLDQMQFDFLIGVGFEFNNRWYAEAEYSRGIKPVFIWGEKDGYSHSISLKLGLNILKPSVTRAKDLGIMPMFE